MRDVVGGPPWCVDASDHVRDVETAMRVRHFDVAGVAVGDTTSVTHFVLREALGSGRGTVGRFAKEIPAAMCVEKSLPLGLLVKRLRLAEHLFVLDGGEIRGIVTRADLGGPAIAMLVFANILGIERSLRDLALQEYGNAWIDRLTAARRIIIEDLYEKRRRDRTDMALSDCAYIPDWETLVLKGESWRRLGFESKNSTREALQLGALRNDLAHGRSILHDRGHQRALDRIASVIELAHSVRRIEQEGDDLAHSYANTVIVRRRAPKFLTGPRATEKFPFANPVHVITSWNPDSVPRPRKVNIETNAMLTTLLQRHRIGYEPCEGRSSDSLWREDSFLIMGQSRERVTEIGCQFGQRAVFELDTDIVRVLACEDGRELVAPRPRRWNLTSNVVR